MNRTTKRSAILQTLEDYLLRVGVKNGMDADVMELMIEISALNEAENKVHSPDDYQSYIKNGQYDESWQKRERTARHNLDSGFFGKVACALKLLQSIQTRPDSDSSRNQLEVATAVIALNIVEGQEELPSWEFVHRRTQVLLSRYRAQARVTDQIQKNRIHDAKLGVEKFKEYFREELSSFQQRAGRKEIKWNEIRKNLGLKDLCDRLTDQEKAQQKGFLA
jgi:hypothetical protein